MKLRKILTAAALAVVSTFGMTVPLATPAAAAGCDTVGSVYGSNERYRSSLDGSYSMSWKATLRSAASCSTAYKYEQFVYDDDTGTLYGRNAVYGTTSLGRTAFDTLITSVVPAGTSIVTYGVRVSKYSLATRSYQTQSERVWLVDVVGYNFDTATGEHAYLKPCDTGISYGYSDPCLPKIPF